MLAGIKKVHIAVSNADFEKWKHRTEQNRKSDNYLIYTQHDLEPDTFLILDFITPDAHKRITAKLADLVLIAEPFQESYSPKLAEKEREFALAKLRQKPTACSRLFCEDCDEPIPELRRQTVQGCTRCVECQQIFEQKQRGYRRD